MALEACGLKNERCSQKSKNKLENFKIPIYDIVMSWNFGISIVEII